MCERFLHCPKCHARLVALCTIAGDNASGLYLEFFLVRPTGTEESAFVPTRVDAVGAVMDVSEALITAEGNDGVPVVPANAGVAYSDERGFDDDEAPTP